MLGIKMMSRDRQYREPSVIKIMQRSCSGLVSHVSPFEPVANEYNLGEDSSCLADQTIEITISEQRGFASARNYCSAGSANPTLVKNFGNASPVNLFRLRFCRDRRFRE